jgi:pyruvate kinase
MSTDDVALRRMAFYHGVIPLKLDQIGTFEDTLQGMIDSVVKKGLINSTGWIVMTAGHPIFQVSHTNMIKVHYLG